MDVFVASDSGVDVSLEEKIKAFQLLGVNSCLLSFLLILVCVLISLNRCVLSSASLKGEVQTISLKSHYKARLEKS